MTNGLSQELKKTHFIYNQDYCNNEDLKRRVALRWVNNKNRTNLFN
jgi:hypothetical protein